MIFLCQQQSIRRRTEELSIDVSEQVKSLAHAYTFLSLALDKSTDISDVDQLSIFIRGIEDNFRICEELADLESLHEKTRGSDIWGKVKLCLENVQLDSSQLHSICTDGAPAMISKAIGFATLL